MFPNWQLVAISIGYIGLLFFIAHIGDKYRHKLPSSSQPIIYALSLGVYCTSWSFLGTTGQAATSVFSYLPIYLGPILLFMFAWPFIQRIIRVSLKLNLTSIADLLAARFGKSHKLAVIVTLVALIGTMPYIALQLKAIVHSYQHLQIDVNMQPWQIGLVVSFVLAGFTMMFGIRTIDVTERHPGVMLAIAFESLIKLIAFLTVGLFVIFVAFDSPVDLWQQSNTSRSVSDQLQLPNLTAMIGSLIIVMAAFLSLPRQFQAMVVELRNEKDTRLSRKVFPLYLLVFAVFAAPLGLAGHLLLGNSVPADAYVLVLPAQQGHLWLTLFAFLGAVSAASSMVIVSSIALSTMLSNEIVFPMLFRKPNKNTAEFNEFRVQLLSIRKMLVFIVITMGYGVFLAAPPDKLASLGEVAFGAIAQLTPALIAAFYWRNASLTGVISGISIGFSLWLLLALFPQFGFYQIQLDASLMPTNTLLTLICLTANIFVLWWVSIFSRQSVQERVQASHFLEWQNSDSLPASRKKNINPSELQLLVSRFVGEEKSTQSFNNFFRKNGIKALGQDKYFEALIQHTERTLASVMGSSSARLVISSAIFGRDMALDQVAMLVEDASSQHVKFSRSLLQSAIENASEGISIIDSELNLVAWNQRYIDLFNYPKELIYIGSPIESLIRFNVTHGLVGPGDIEDQIQKRINYLKQGSPHSSERHHNDGRVIRIEGNPLPNGGFVMMFSDITAYRQAEQVLKEANLDLETRVQERTKKLEQMNAELLAARSKAELAYQRKSQYLKACSHDLMQPLEAARLFSSALCHQKGLSEQHIQQVNHIEHSLKIATDMLSELADIARIESGNITPKLTPVSVEKLFTSLQQEFHGLAIESHITLEVKTANTVIVTDEHLLRRILQNLLGNACRYASPGKVVLSSHVEDNRCIISVRDNGPGIPEVKQAEVFEQFTQLETPSVGNNKGLGLGLNITKSFAQLLEHPLNLTSNVGQGCCFSVAVPLANEGLIEAPIKVQKVQGLVDVRVLCVDNDPDVLAGMEQLLQAWQCTIFTANSIDSAEAIVRDHSTDIDIMLVDYQLDNNENGINLMRHIEHLGNKPIPGILVTATVDENVQEKATDFGFSYMRKPVKPAALRALMSSILAKNLQQFYASSSENSEPPTSS